MSSKPGLLCADFGTGILGGAPVAWTILSCVALQICKMSNLYSHSLSQIHQKADGHEGLLRNLWIVLQRHTWNCKSELKYGVFQKEQTDFKTCGWTVFTLIGKLEDHWLPPHKQKLSVLCSRRYLRDSHHICTCEIVPIVSNVSDLGKLFNQSFFFFFSAYLLTTSPFLTGSLFIDSLTWELVLTTSKRCFPRNLVGFLAYAFSLFWLPLQYLFSLR